MRNGFRQILGRSACLLAAFGLLAGAIPGCGDEPIKKDEAAGGIPAVLKKSNDNMENFMKTKNAPKKD